MWGILSNLVIALIPGDSNDLSRRKIQHVSTADEIDRGTVLSCELNADKRVKLDQTKIKHKTKKIGSVTDFPCLSLRGLQNEKEIPDNTGKGLVVIKSEVSLTMRGTATCADGKQQRLVFLKFHSC